MPNVMVALPNIGGALCSTSQFDRRPLPNLPSTACKKSRKLADSYFMAVIFNIYKRSTFLCNSPYPSESFNFALVTPERHLTLSVLSSSVTMSLHFGHHLSPKQQK